MPPLLGRGDSGLSSSSRRSLRPAPRARAPPARTPVATTAVAEQAGRSPLPPNAPPTPARPRPPPLPRTVPLRTEVRTYVAKMKAATRGWFACIPTRFFFFFSFSLPDAATPLPTLLLTKSIHTLDTHTKKQGGAASMPSSSSSTAHEPHWLDAIVNACDDVVGMRLEAALASATAAADAAIESRVAWQANDGGGRTEAVVAQAGSVAPAPCAPPPHITSAARVGGTQATADRETRVGGVSAATTV